MKLWLIKAFVQKTISLMPFSFQLNFLFQKYITRGVKLTNEYLEDRLIHFQWHISAFFRYAYNQSLKTSLELGTGWYPIVPLCFYLSGANKIYSVDITGHIDWKSFKATVEKLLEYYHSGKLQPYFIEIKKDRILVLEGIVKKIGPESLPKILKRLHIELLVCDARNLPLPVENVDLITSNNTLEHIPEEIIVQIFSEFKRVSVKSGYMSHFVDMSDHFAHLDKSITIYNFLQFSPEKWHRIDNNVQPQNRLRISHYRKLYQGLDLKILDEEITPGNKEDLDKIKVDESFLDLTKEELAVSHVYFFSQF